MNERENTKMIIGGLPVKLIFSITANEEVAVMVRDILKNSYLQRRE